MGLTFFHSHIAFFNRTVIYMIHSLLLALSTLNYFTFVLLLPHQKIAEYYQTMSEAPGCVYVHTVMWYQTSGGINKSQFRFQIMSASYFCYVFVS